MKKGKYGDIQMLELSRKHIKDEKADSIIARYLNGNILELVGEKMVDYKRIRKKDANTNPLPKILLQIEPAVIHAILIFQ